MIQFDMRACQCRKIQIAIVVVLTSSLSRNFRAEPWRAVHSIRPGTRWWIRLQVGKLKSYQDLLVFWLTFGSDRTYCATRRFLLASLDVHVIKTIYGVVLVHALVVWGYPYQYTSQTSVNNLLYTSLVSVYESYQRTKL